MFKNMSRRFSQKLLLVLFVWGCMLVNAQAAERWWRAWAQYPKYMTSQWYTGTDYYGQTTALKELCDLIGASIGFTSFGRRGGTRCRGNVGGNHSYDIGMRLSYTNNDPNPPPPEPEKKYTIKLSQVTAKPSKHGNYITDIYPDKNFINNSEPSANPVITSDALVAIVYDENGQKINNVNIHVEIEPVESTAGHFKHGVRPKKVSTYGQLVTTTSLDLQLEGNTGTEGFKFRYLASELSGDYNIKVTCKDKVCNQTQPSKVWVGVENLIPLEEIPSLYEFVGDKPTHPDNHYVTEKTRVKMIILATKYKTKFPNNAVLHYNDSSLERGGLFDVGKVKWKPPHEMHRVGTDVDVRANEAFGNIPSKDDADFRRLAKKSGCFADLEDAGTIYEHFHLYCERRFD